MRFRTLKIAIPAALLGLGALVTGRAMSGPQPGVELFSPTGSVERVEQIKLRFTTPMVAFGDPRAAAPVSGACAAGAQARWVDARTFALDLPKPLAGGRRCVFTLNAGLRDAGGAALSGPRSFAFDTGGPNLRAVLPEEDSSEIEEDAVFLLALNARPTPASIAAHASCAIEGVGESVPLDILPDAQRDLVLKGSARAYQTRNFLGQAGLRAPEYEGEEIGPPSAVVAAKCRRALPAGGRVALVWGAGVASPDGLVTAAAVRRDYRVRPEFAARFECDRSTAAQSCSPLGTMRLRFTGQVPVAQASAIRLVGPRGTVPAAKFDTHAQTVSDVSFKGPFEERATYRVELPASLTDDSGRRLSNAARFPLATQTGDAPPLIKFAGSFGIVEAAEGGVLPVTMRGVEAPTTGLQIAPVKGRDLALVDDAHVAMWLRTLADAEDTTIYAMPIAGSKETRTVNTTRSTPLLKPGAPTTALSVAKPGGARAFEVVGIPLRTNGFHVVEFASPALGKALLGQDRPRYIAAGALVTDLAVHFQWGRGTSLVWVTRLKDAGVVAGARITILDSCTGKPFWTGVTDASGRAAVGDVLPDPSSYGSCRYGQAPLMVSARTAGDYSFTLTSWNDGIQPGDFSMPTGYGAPEDIWHSVFDRTLLRAGDTVHIKHLIRATGDGGFAPPKSLPKQPSLVIRHTGSDQQWELPLTLRPDGSGVSEWAIPKAAALGTYEVSIGETGATDDRHISGSFSVEEFRLPTIRASVRGPAAQQVAPAAVPLDLSLTYLSGGAVSRAPVKLRTRVEPREISVADYPNFSFSGEPLVAGIVPLDGGGDAARAPLRAAEQPVTLDAKGAARVTIDRLAPLTGPARLVAEMDYDDANGEVATTSTGVDLDPAAYRVGIAGDGWLAKADDLRLKMVVLDGSNRPVAGARVSVALFSRETYSYRKRLVGGFYSYDNSRETKQLDKSCSGTSDSKGLVACAIDVGVSGEVIAQATVRDPVGRTAQATKSVWLAGDDDWYFGGDNGDRMDVVPEAPEYAAGATARLQVRMPFRSATALVSVLRDGVIDSFVTNLSGKDPVVEVKLKRGYAPNVYISVLAVRGRVAGWRLWLADLARRWNLPWISRDAASPTALVDLAKPSYRLGLAKLRVGWDDHRLGVKVATDAPTYGVRKVATASITVVPPPGRNLPAGSEIAFAAVDEALLQLQDNSSWDVLTAMMGERPLWVQTSTAQGQVVGKRHYGLKAVAAGGDGGAAGGLTRKDFKPLLLWLPRVPLDGQGRARIAVPLNDALTGFRLVAVATGGADLFGMGSVSIRTTQPLQLLAGIPPLVREGDRYVATVLVRNATTKPMRVALTATAGTVTLPPRTVDIAANDAATVGWGVAAPTKGQIRWQISARSATAADAVQVEQTVATAVPVAVWQSTLVQLSPAVQFPVALPVGAIPGRGGLDVAVSRTLGGSLPGVRAYMAAYRYDCIEQQLSRAVALNDRAMWDRSAALLPAYLDGDGLVRFFPAEWIAGDDSLTAYILRLSADAGWPLPADVRGRMITGLQAFVAGRLERSHARMLVIDKSSGDAGITGFGGDMATRRLGAVAALASVRAATPAMVEPIALTPDAWPTSGVVDWAYILQTLPGIPDAAAKLQQASNQLRVRLDLQGTRLTIARSDDPWQLLASPDSTAARLLAVVVPLADWRTDIGGVARGLMLKQKQGHWDTTVANAVGTLAMRRFSAAFESVPVTGTTQAVVPGEAKAFGWASAPTPATLPWPAGKAELVLRHSGTGAPWATLTSRAAVPLTRPFASGFAVSRQVFVVSRAVPDRWSRGDVMRVRVTVTPRAPVEWVVIDDPIPAGATIQGGSLGGRSQMLAGGDTTGLQPTFVERRSDAVHAHYEAMPKGATTYEYTLRLNSEGVFRLPPTRVEALYSPEMMAMVPNKPVEVAAAK